ncbi:MAG: hypothetical protein ACRDKT_15785 [Actinomycetota bacterium]
MRKLLVVALVWVALPTSAVGQGAQCDGNFDLVHEVGRDGSLDDVDVPVANEGWAVGYHTVPEEPGTDEGPHSLPLAVRFDDTSFERMTPEDLPGAELFAVEAVSPTDVWAVGFYYTRPYRIIKPLVFHYDGTAWTRMRAPSPGRRPFLRGVAATGPDDVWAIGDYFRPRTATMETLVIHYDGTSWAQVDAPSPGRRTSLHAIDATSPNDVWAAGWRGSQRPVVLRFNGTAWRHVKLGKRFDDNLFFGLDAVTRNEAWATGRQGLAVHFVDGRWRRRNTPDLRGKEWNLDVAATTDEAWTVGYRSTASSMYTWGAHRVDGSWSVVSFEGGPEGDMEAVTLDPAGTAWAVGDLFDTTARETRDVIEKACST